MSNYRLTGGTFFNLLTNAKEKTPKKIIKEQGYDSFSDAYLLEDLKIIASEQYEKKRNGTSTVPDKAFCSKFKNCKIEYSPSYLDLSKDSDLIKDFNILIKNNLNSRLLKVNDFINKWFKNDNHKKCLANAILKLIELDNSIQSKDKIYIESNNKILSKAELLKLDTINLSNLILSCWYYILSNYIENSNGKDTIDSWKTNTGKINWEEWKPIEKKLTIINTEININAPIVTNTLDSIKSIQENNDFSSNYAHAKKLKGAYMNYYRNACNDLSLIKTILYNDEPVNFYKDIYVAPDIESKEKNLNGINSTPKNYISIFGQYTSIKAPAGYGKTLFLKHLFLCESLTNIHDENKTHLVPIFLEIRFFSKNDSLENLLYNSISQYMDLDFKKFHKDLSEGIFLILIDGLDEISQIEKNDFYSKFKPFLNKYSNNFYVTSSRPNENTAFLNKIKTVTLLGLKHDRALKMIKKLPTFNTFTENDRNKFIEWFDGNNTKIMNDISENPLMLTLMFLIYIKKKKIPLHTYRFYDEAFDVLYERHDKLKGISNRPFKTKLNKFEFKRLLSEFAYQVCSIQKYSLKEYDIYQLLNKTSFKNLSVTDFIDDVHDNLNLFYLQNDIYTMLHRSFYDYFCANYFKLNDPEYKEFKNWIKYQNENDLRDYDSNIYYFDIGVTHSNVIKLLMEMDEKNFNRHFTKSIIRDLINTPYNQKSYYDFLSNEFQTFNYGIESAFVFNSTLLKLVMFTCFDKTYIELSNLKFPEYLEYQNEGLYYDVDVCDGQAWITGVITTTEIEINKNLLTDKEFSQKYSMLDLEKPDDYNYSIPFKDIFDNESKFKEIVDFLNSKDCVLKIIYDGLIEILKI